MQCAFRFRLYNENDRCLPERVVINTLGMCEDCIMICIPKEDLAPMKAEQRKDLDDFF